MAETDRRYELVLVWADGNPEVYETYATAEEALRVRDMKRQEYGRVPPAVLVWDSDDYERGALDEHNLREDEEFLSPFVWYEIPLLALLVGLLVYMRVLWLTVKWQARRRRLLRERRTRVREDFLWGVARQTWKELGR